MRIYIITLLFIIGFISCKPGSKKDKVYYIYDPKSIFSKSEVKFDTTHFITFDIGRMIPCIPEGLSQRNQMWVTYSLWHYISNGKYKDISFMKHKSYLDSIDFYGTEWLKNNDNLSKFWKRYRGCPDSLKIYLIEPIKGTDSLIFRRVHRNMIVPDD